MDLSNTGSMWLQTKKYWNQLIKQLTHPKTPLPERPEEWGPLPSWQAQHTNSTHKDDSDNSDSEDKHNNNHESNKNQPPPPPPQPTEQTYDPKQWLNDHNMCEMVGHNLGPSLCILDLGLGASKIEVKLKYRQLSQINHPDKNNSATTGLTTDEASEFFKLLNNANKYLKDDYDRNWKFEM